MDESGTDGSSLVETVIVEDSKEAEGAEGAEIGDEDTVSPLVAWPADRANTVSENQASSNAKGGGPGVDCAAEIPGLIPKSSRGAAVIGPSVGPARGHKFPAAAGGSRLAVTVERDAQVSPVEASGLGGADTAAGVGTPGDAVVAVAALGRCKSDGEPGPLPAGAPPAAQPPPALKKGWSASSMLTRAGSAVGGPAAGRAAAPAPAAVTPRSARAAGAWGKIVQVAAPPPKHFFP